MMAQLLAQTNLTLFSRISLILFLSIYLVALWRAFHPQFKAQHEKMSKLVFEDDGE